MGAIGDLTSLLLKRPVLSPGVGASSAFSVPPSCLRHPQPSQRSRRGVCRPSRTPREDGAEAGAGWHAFPWRT